MKTIMIFAAVLAVTMAHAAQDTVINVPVPIKAAQVNELLTMLGGTPAQAAAKFKAESFRALERDGLEGSCNKFGLWAGLQRL